MSTKRPKSSDGVMRAQRRSREATPDAGTAARKSNKEIANEAALETASGSDLKPYFDAWVFGKGAPELDAGESSVGRSPIVASATRKAGGEGLSFLRPSSERKPVPPGFPRMNGELNLSLYVS